MLEEFKNATIACPVILDLGLRKTHSGKPYDHCDTFKLRFKNVFCPHANKKLNIFSNSFSLKSIFKKFCFHDRLLWTVGPILEIELCFQIYLL